MLKQDALSRMINIKVIDFDKTDDALEQVKTIDRIFAN